MFSVLLNYFEAVNLYIVRCKHYQAFYKPEGAEASLHVNALRRTAVRPQPALLIMGRRTMGCTRLLVHVMTVEMNA